MKKILKITAVVFAFAVVACSKPVSSGPDVSSNKPTKDQLVREATTKCQTLGFDQGTKEFQDCTSTQFNRMQNKWATDSR